jgi:hypothetical protein
MESQCQEDLPWPISLKWPAEKPVAVHPLHTAPSTAAPQLELLLAL